MPKADNYQKTKSVIDKDDLKWITILDDETAEDLIPTADDDGVTTLNDVGEANYISLSATGTDGALTVQPTLWVYADGDWWMIEEMANYTQTYSHDPGGGVVAEIRYIFRRYGLGNFDRFFIGIKGTPAGSPTALVVKVAYVAL